SRRMAALDPKAKDQILNAMADALELQAATIIQANQRDLADGQTAGLSKAMLDRLMLNEQRIQAMANGLREIALLPDPVGHVLESWTRPNGLVINKTAVPIGVLLVIYESRPNVTADAAGLCFKSSNAVILRGGSESLRSNQAILNALVAGGGPLGLPEHAIQLVPTSDRNALYELLAMPDCIDLVIPRGGHGLIRAVAEHSKIPVLKHYNGVCHVYVDEAADLEMAKRIAVNAKCQRPGVCNAMETLLVHEAIAPDILPDLGQLLLNQGVEIRGDERVRKLISQAVPVTEEDWRTEYLDLILSVRVVPNLDAAIDHIEDYGSHHSDVIVTSNPNAAERFKRAIDSSTVYVNASSRFTDGAEFGMGAEIGISTDKLHARG
ncbi:MAG TPA: glutamate-5-semialdehyde dehydrogenase, partial [Verrucomicrobia bacterium]|nr:glutamate-5-semialdehyde dehydrogenase [Verrucomicrobiota bacterium]